MAVLVKGGVWVPREGIRVRLAAVAAAVAAVFAVSVAASAAPEPSGEQALAGSRIPVLLRAAHSD